MRNEISIADLRMLCDERKFKWTAHIVTRLQERDINPSDVKSCIKFGEIIEQYPTDFPHPSCLVSGVAIDSRPLHVVVGVSMGYLWLVTSYFPDPNKWEQDFKTRKVLSK